MNVSKLLHDKHPEESQVFQRKLITEVLSKLGFEQTKEEDEFSYPLGKVFVVFAWCADFFHFVHPQVTKSLSKQFSVCTPELRYIFIVDQREVEAMCTESIQRWVCLRKATGYNG